MQDELQLMRRSESDLALARDYFRTLLESLPADAPADERTYFALRLAIIERAMELKRLAAH